MDSTSMISPNNPFTNDTICSMISWTDFKSDIDKLSAEFEYVGPSPKQTMAFLISKEKNPMKLASDVRLIALIYFCRGTNVTKMQEKIGKAGYDKLKELVAKYQIIASASNITSPPLFTTIGRISQAAPAIFAKVAHLMDPPSYGIGLPKCYRFPSASCIVPKGSDIAKLHKEWCVEFGKVINPGGSFQERFWAIGHNSDYVSRDEREAIFSNYGSVV